ncbi:MAG: hypothetical protein DID89_2727547068 [Candidatus Nitrotoga sp. CP45]|nr:MAG: hypothetical protein DID89_2727547068 [Candidatus Nitrotoga sp. CP45]
MQTVGSDSIDKESSSQDGEESVSVSVSWQRGDWININESVDSANLQQLS